MVVVTVLMKEMNWSHYSLLPGKISTVRSQDRTKLSQYSTLTRQNEAGLGHYSHKTGQSFFAAAGSAATLLPLLLPRYCYHPLGEKEHKPSC